MKGFTLIELLVVVIIIGILAAIALPQYELVVEKSRASEAMINTKALRDAVDRHDQEFPGEAVTTNDQIADVQLKGGSWFSSSTFGTDNFIYSLAADTVTVCRRGEADNCNDNAYTITYTRNGDGKWFVNTGSCSGNYAQVCRLFEMTASTGSAGGSNNQLQNDVQQSAGDSHNSTQHSGGSSH